jgi:hypothetical protein
VGNLLYRSKEGRDMSERQWRNHAMAFNVKLALGVLKGDQTIVAVSPGVSGTNEPDYYMGRAVVGSCIGGIQHGA